MEEKSIIEQTKQFEMLPCEVEREYIDYDGIKIIKINIILIRNTS